MRKLSLAFLLAASCGDSTKQGEIEVRNARTGALLSDVLVFTADAAGVTANWTDRYGCCLIGTPRCLLLVRSGFLPQLVEKAPRSGATFFLSEDPQESSVRLVGKNTYAGHGRAAVEVARFVERQRAGRVIHREEKTGGFVVVRLDAGDSSPVRLHDPAEHEALSCLCPSDVEAFENAFDRLRSEPMCACAVQNPDRFVSKTPSDSERFQPDSGGIAGPGLALSAFLEGTPRFGFPFGRPSWAGWSPRDSRRKPSPAPPRVRVTVSPSHHRPGDYETSEYPFGRIAINVVLVSSRDSDRDFSKDDRRDALADLVEAMDFWTQKLPQAQLTFVYKSYDVEVPGIPIEGTGNGFIPAAMEKTLGASADGWSSIYELNNRTRREMGCDWAYTCFLVKGAQSVKDLWNTIWHGPRGRFVFGDGSVPHAFLGGPAVVMPYSRVLGLHFWNPAILAHEFGHIFYAQDEYHEAYVRGGTVQQRTGYFQIENGNLDAPGARSNQSCIMRNSSTLTAFAYLADRIREAFLRRSVPGWDTPVCEFTRSQMGCIDSNRDGRIDPLDAPLTVEMTQTVRTDARNVRIFLGLGAETNLIPGHSDINLDALEEVRLRIGSASWKTIGEARGTPAITIEIEAPRGSSRAVELRATTRTGVTATRSYQFGP